MYFSQGQLKGQVTKIKWRNLQEIEVELRKNPKKVIVEVYSKECEWCKKFEAEVLNNPIIYAYLNKHYYLAKIDVFDKTPFVFKNKVLLATNGFHPLTAEYLKGQAPMSFPTQLFFDEKLNFLNFLKGYNTAANFEIAIAYFGEDFNKTATWDQFLKIYKGKIK
jgi:hypothetical protein